MLNLVFSFRSSRARPFFFIEATTGDVGFGTTTPDAKVEIQTGSAFGAAGLLLDQDDTDMPFVKFEGTAGDINGSANVYSGDVSDTGSTFPAAAIKVNVGGTDYWMPLYAIPAP